MNKEKLTYLRSQIDLIDNELITALSKRVLLVKEVGNIKKTFQPCNA